MNTYRIKYKAGYPGVRRIVAETVNGSQPDRDTYVFKNGPEIVAMIPKAVVASINKISSDDD